MEEMKTEIKQEKPRLLLIFGQGPIIDKTTRFKASDVQAPTGDEDINFWSKNIAEAASMLVKRGVNTQLVIMGGKTGGQHYASESELISNQIIDSNIPPDTIVQEKESLDTIENLINFLNTSNEDILNNREFDVLCASYHTTRLRILLKLFEIPVRHVFGAEEVLRFAARTSENTVTTDSSIWNNNTLALLERELDTNVQNDFYLQQKGTEKRDILDRRLTEDALIRELLIFPEKWLSQVGKIANDTHLQKILEQTEALYPDLLEEKFGIKMRDSMDEKRARLSEIIYTPIPTDEFEKWKKETQARKPWPKQVSQKFDMLIG